MTDIWRLFAMYLFALPLAVFAFRWGIRRIRLTEPPEGVVRSMQTAVQITDADDKLAECRRQGMGALVASAALIFGPVITVLSL